MVVKDPEELDATLTSVQGLVSEIIIAVDSKTSLSVKEIGSKYGAKFVDFLWKDDFSHARNESIRDATGEWILILDSDEILDPDGVEKIKRLVQDSAVEGYFLMQHNYTDEFGWLGWTPVRDMRYSGGKKGFFISPILRLFRNFKGYHFTYLVHEAVDPSILEKQGKIAEAEVPVHHYGYCKPKKVIEEKIKRCLAGGLRQIALTPKDPKPYYELGQIYMHADDPKKALEMFAKVESLDKKFRSLYLNMGAMYQRLGEMEKAKEAYDQALQVNPKDYYALLSLGGLSMKQGNLKNAVALVKKAIDTMPHSIGAYNRVILYLIRHEHYTEAKDLLLHAMVYVGYKNFMPCFEELRRVKPQIIVEISEEMKKRKVSLNL